MGGKKRKKKRIFRKRLRWENTQTMAVNVKFAGLFKLMCPIDGPCRSESESTFNLKIPAVFLEKSTFKKNVTLVKNLSRKIFPLKFFIVSNERGGRKK